MLPKGDSIVLHPILKRSLVHTTILTISSSSLFPFPDHQTYKSESIEKAYNALTLLGEFYNILRISEQPISILGQSLIQALNQELLDVLEKKTALRPSLAKLVLTQVTLNGVLFKKYEQEKLNPLLDSMRRVIVEADSKGRRGKAYLMLAMDLYHSHFTTNAMVALQKVYGVYLDETQPTLPATDPFQDQPISSSADAATNTSRTSNHHMDDDQHVPEKRQRVEIAVQTEVAICDVFRDGPVIMTPVERASIATTCTNLSLSREDNSSSKATTTPPSPSATNSSGTRKSKIDPRIRNVKIGRVYPKPTFPSSPTTISPPRALSVSTMDNGCESVAKLSIKNVTLHELAMMKENPSHLNRITNGYLDRLAPPSEIRCPSIKSASEYTGKENNESERNGSGGSKKTSPVAAGGQQRMTPVTSNGNSNNNNKITMEENFDTITYDPSFFDDYVPHNGHAGAKSFLQFLGNK